MSSCSIGFGQKIAPEKENLISENLIQQDFRITTYDTSEENRINDYNTLLSPPFILLINGTLGNNEWYISNITLTLTQYR